MSARALLLVCTGALLVFRAAAQPLDLQGYRLVDLTHPYNSNTVFWPSPPAQFELKKLHFGDTPGGFFYSANTFCTPEHGGTHLDAPIHFARSGETADRVPLERLIGPVVVIDVSDKAAADRDYRVTAADVLAFEAQHGRIAPGTRVLVRTDWSRQWPNATAYLGHATDAAKLHFPAYGADAARLLVEERQVGAARHRYRLDRLRSHHGFPRAPDSRGGQRPGSRERHRPRRPAAARRGADRVADENRGRFGRADARRRARAARRADALAVWQGPTSPQIRGFR